MGGQVITSRCDIKQAGKSRNGKPRWWCMKHGAPATGRYGVRLEECESAHLDIDQLNCLNLDPSLYRGGIGIWGAVPPVFDTTGQTSMPGIHVHARKEEGGPKVIDDNFSVVAMKAQTDLFSSRPVTITHEAAVAQYVANFLGHQVKYLFCVRCGALHLDAGYFATKPHKRHLCHSCGNYFTDSERGISNPIAYFRTLSVDFSRDLRVQSANRAISFSQNAYPGGIQIWASNPALVWTADRQEEEGIHLHAFDGCNEMPVIDNTFSSVCIDGIDLDYRQIAQLMAQKALPHLANKIVSLQCPQCQLPHFDEGMHGVTPHKEHQCKGCGRQFNNPGRRKLTVSNPAIAALELLERNHLDQR